MLAVFIGIASGSFICLLILLILNIDHEFEIGHEMEVGHEIDVGHEVDVGHEIEAGHEVAHEIGDLGEAGPSFLSVRLFLFFLLGFGAFGIIGTVLELPIPLAVAAATAGAFVSYFTAYQILKLLWKQQVSTEFSISSLIGTKALVTQRIPADGVGEIKAKSPQSGLENYISAKTADPQQSIEKNEIVTVKNVVSSICIVEKES